MVEGELESKREANQRGADPQDWAYERVSEEKYLFVKPENDDRGRGNSNLDREAGTEREEKRDKAREQENGK